MKKIHVTKKFKKFVILSEVDIDFDMDFGVDNEADDELSIIELGEPDYYLDGSLIKIDILIDELSKLKQMDCTHIELDVDIDHYGYNIAGYEIDLSTAVEIEEYEKKFKDRIYNESIKVLEEKIEDIKKKHL